MSVCEPTLARSATAISPPDPAFRPGRLALLAIVEPFDLVTADRVLARADRLAKNTRCLVIDMLASDYIDSAGVRALVYLADELEAADKELRLVIEPGSRVERTLKLLLLLEHFRVFNSLGAACTAEAALSV